MSTATDDRGEAVRVLLGGTRLRLATESAKRTPDALYMEWLNGRIDGLSEALRVLGFQS